MGHSTPAVRAAKVRPDKPRDDFPLFPHRNGRWAKKVLGRFVYFGRWDTDPKGEKAIQIWLDQRDALLAGRKPRAANDGLRIDDLAEDFCTHKQARVESGDIAQRTFDDYHTVCKRIVRVFGEGRRVDDLDENDFAKLRADAARTLGLVALLNFIVRARSVFKFAYDQRLIPAPVRYGQSFDLPTRKKLRIERAKRGKLMFDAPQLLAMLNGKTINKKKIAGASQPLRSMILLGINCGFGNNDVALLPIEAVNLSSGWIEFPRPKTGAHRRVPLWPETIRSLRDWLKLRPEPKSDDAKELLFVTSRGGSWAKTKADNPTSKETCKLLKRLSLHRAGLNFYSLRRTFRTIASETRDEAAADFLMGHAPEATDMAATYRQTIGDDRLIAVTNHVRAWLFNKRAK